MSSSRSGAPRGDGPRRAPEERAEELMERATTELSRRLTRFAGRAREEFEDIVAEARTVKERWGAGEQD